MKIKFFSTILFCLSSTLIQAQAPTNGLVASYPFNGNANDESGNGNNGVVNGATLTSDRFGKANSAYSFDGVSNSISLPLNLNGTLINSKKLTISAFVNTNSTIGGGIFSNWKASPPTDPTGILFNIGDGLKLSAATNGGTGVTTKNAIAPNQWVHVVAVFDGDMKNALDRMKLYINGVNAVADSGALVYSNRVIADNIGNTATNTEIARWKSQFNWSGYFKGSLDDIKIYNRALSISEITALYNDDNTGLIAHYPFNGNAKDMSGNGNHGVVNGATLTTDRFGKANSAYSFDGKSSFIKVPSIGSTAFNSDFSIEAWVNIRDFTNPYPHIIQGENNFLAFHTTGSAYTVQQQSKISFYTVYGSKITDQQPITGTRLIPNNAIIPVNKWNQIVISKLKDTIRYYYNGAMEYKGFYENKPLILGNYLLIGTAINSQSDYTLNGVIDDIKIYQKALSTSEITSLYNENKCFETISVTDTLRISSIAGINSLPESFGDIKVYPNPAHDILNISISKPSTDYNIKIADNMGKTIYTSAMTSNNLQINLNQFTAKGLYLIQILDNTNKVLDVRKLVLE